MGCYALRQRLQVIASFERRDDTTIGIALRHIDDLPRYPGIVAFRQCQRRHVIIPMGIETGRDKQHLRCEPMQGRQPCILYCIPELCASAVGSKRNIDHMLRATLGAAVRIERMLKGGNHGDTGITGEYVFSAVAVMHVEIYNRDTLKSMHRKGMRDPYRNIVEDAESHGPPPAGMVSWRTHVAKAVFDLASDDHIRRHDNRTGCISGG